MTELFKILKNIFIFYTHHPPLPHPSHEAIPPPPTLSASNKKTPLQHHIDDTTTSSKDDHTSFFISNAVFNVYRLEGDVSPPKEGDDMFSVWTLRACSYKDKTENIASGR